MNAKRARTGWGTEEEQLLWQEIAKAADNGESLKSAFDKTAELTGRKPNSVRNFYYANIKEKAQDQGMVQTNRMLPFTPFSDEEVKNLVWRILNDRAQGMSVRASVQRMADGDRTLMLRYQNKYRSMLKSHPEWIRNQIEEMRSQGIPTVDPYAHQRMLRAVPTPESADTPQTTTTMESIYTEFIHQLRAIGDDNAIALLKGLRALVIAAAKGTDNRKWMEERDRLAVRCDLLRLELAKRDEELMNLRESGNEVLHSARQLMDTNRNFLGLDSKTRRSMLAEYTKELAVLISAFENASGE